MLNVKYKWALCYSYHYARHNMQEIQSVARVILIWLDTARIKNMRLTVRRKILRYVASIYESRHCQRRSIIHHYNTTKK